MLNRRLFLQGGSGIVLAGSATAGYACGVEPGLLLDTTTYNLVPPRWPADLSLTCAVIADIHACDPWMSVSRLREIVARTNALRPDLIVILGDFTAGHDYVTGPVYPSQWSEVLGELHAPLGVFAILGNHDMWHGALVTEKPDVEAIRRALRRADCVLLENRSVPLVHDGRKLWLAGLADQIALTTGLYTHRGLDDLAGTLGQVTDDAPILLLAHEPYIFPRVPDRVSLTLCGHTHGGQVFIPGVSPWWHGPYGGSLHSYGHVVENGRHMIISAGLGTSLVPVRFMRPPEIVLVRLGKTDSGQVITPG